MSGKRIRLLVRHGLLPRVAGGYTVLLPRLELERILAGAHPDDADVTIPWTVPATLDTFQSARVLGFNVERVRRMIRDGQIEAIRYGRLAYVLIRPLRRQYGLSAEEIIM